MKLYMSFFIFVMGHKKIIIQILEENKQKFLVFGKQYKERKKGFLHLRASIRFWDMIILHKNIIRESTYQIQQHIIQHCGVDYQIIIILDEQIKRPLR